MRPNLPLVLLALVLLGGVYGRPHSTAHQDSTDPDPADQHHYEQQHHGEHHHGQQHHDGQQHDGQQHDGQQHDRQQHDGQQHDGQQHHEGNDLVTRHNHRHQAMHRLRQHHQKLLDAEKQRVCGSRLSDMLRRICAGRGYYDPDSTAGTGSSTARTRNVGLATECCHVGCSIKDLEQYCQPRSSESESGETTNENSSTPSANQIRPVRPAQGDTRLENDIRPLAGGDQPEKRESGTPTVVGERTGLDASVTKTLKNEKDMIKVGTLRNPYRTHAITARHQTNHS